MKTPFYSAVATATLAFLTVTQAPAQSKHEIFAPGVISYSVAPASNMPVGSPVQGLGAALKSSSSVVHAGEQIVLSLEVRNTSKERRWLYRPNTPCSYDFKVTNLRTNRSTTVTPDNCGDFYGSPIDGLDKGESAFLEFKFPEASLSGPGTYEIVLTSITWYPRPDVAPEDLKIVSMPVKIMVLP